MGEKMKKIKSNYLSLHISGKCSHSAAECRLLDVHDRIENYRADYDKLNLALLKYERIQLLKRVFKNK